MVVFYTFFTFKVEVAGILMILKFDYQYILLPLILAYRFYFLSVI